MSELSQEAKAKAAEHGQMMTERSAMNTEKAGEHGRKIEEQRLALDEKMIKHKDTAGRSIERGLKSNNHKK
jgi:hypothetical protein